MERDFFSTGQAARLCSVTSDTVLRWIKSGRLRGLRTGGGHYRIPKTELERHLGLQARRQSCWEYHRRGTELTQACRQCIVYRARAQRCWELAQPGVAVGHTHAFRITTCEKCDYFLLQRGRVAHVLVFSEDPELAARLKEPPATGDLEMEVADCEYKLSTLIESFRPEFVIIDGAIGAVRVRKTATALLRDPPCVRVVVAFA